jgi:hypothetical protein
MGLEAATYINQLVATNPVGATDPRSQGDDHLRLIKSVLQATFPAFTGAVLSTQTELNAIHGAQWLNLNAGAGSAPAYSFSGDPNTGMYSLAADVIGFSTAGVLRFNLGSFGIRGPVGSVAVPSYSIDADPDTGLYSAAGNALGIACGGAIGAVISAGQVSLQGNDVLYELQELDQGADGKVWWVRAQAGALTIQTRTDALGAGNTAISIARSGTAISNIAMGANLLVVDGALATPGVAFSLDPNTGIWRSGADTINIVAGGVAVFTGDTGNVHLGNSAGYILDLGGVGQSNTVGAAGAAAALPATPAFYAAIAFAGALRKIPVYNF